MTEEALAAPAPAPVSAKAAEAAPAKAVEPKTEQEDAGAAPKTADDGAGAAVTAAAPTTAPVQTQEAAAGDAAADKGPPPADSVIAARLRELLEETDLEKTSGEREREEEGKKSERIIEATEGRRRQRAQKADWSLALRSLLMLCPPLSPAS